MQTGLLFELAAFAAAECTHGVELAHKYTQLAAGWALAARGALKELGVGSSARGEAAAALRVACVTACALVVRSYGFATALPNSELTRQDVSLLLRHLALARHMLPSCTQAEQEQTQALWSECEQVAAALQRTVALCVDREPTLLTEVVRVVYPGAGELSDGEGGAQAGWEPAARHGCFSGVLTEAGTGVAVFTVDALSGRVLRSGREPFALPDSVLEHPVYQESFGALRLQVNADNWTTREPLHGRFYEFNRVKKGLIILEHEPLPGGKRSTLELLPGAHMPGAMAGCQLWQAVHSRPRGIGTYSLFCALLRGLCITRGAMGRMQAVRLAGAIRMSGYHSACKTSTRTGSAASSWSCYCVARRPPTARSDT